MTTRYYLITDIGTQWFAYIVAARQIEATETRRYRYNVVDYYKLDKDIQSEFISNIYAREPHFHLAEFLAWTESGDYGGWSISKKEFDKLKEIIDIYPQVLRFEKLNEITTI